jgi:hypothetical protein
MEVKYNNIDSRLTDLKTSILQSQQDQFHQIQQTMKQILQQQNNQARNDYDNEDINNDSEEAMTYPQQDHQLTSSYQPSITRPQSGRANQLTKQQPTTQRIMLQMPITLEEQRKEAQAPAVHSLTRNGTRFRTSGNGSDLINSSSTNSGIPTSVGPRAAKKVTTTANKQSAGNGSNHA